MTQEGIDMDIRMSFEDFADKYKPVPNLMVDPNGHSYMFETYGEEVEQVKAQPIQNIWTLVDTADAFLIVSGWRIVNRLGYFITEVPYDEDTQNEEYIYS